MLDFVPDLISHYAVNGVYYLKDTGRFSSEMFVTRALNVLKRLPLLMHTLKKRQEFVKVQMSTLSIAFYDCNICLF